MAFWTFILLEDMFKVNRQYPVVQFMRGGGGGQEGGLVTDHRDLKHKITNHRVFK